MTYRIAVLIDGENISHRYFERILQQLRGIGDLVVVRIYGDWSRQSMAGWQSVAQSHPINPVHQFQRRKNTIDFHLAMDAVDIFHKQPEINHFCIISSDSDFSALCLWLRDKGKFVSGYGEAKSSQDYMNCFNDFKVLDKATEYAPGKVHLPIRNLKMGTEFDINSKWRVERCSK